jgi:hypothetical protein
MGLLIVVLLELKVRGAGVESPVKESCLKTAFRIDAFDRRERLRVGRPGSQV